MLMQLLLTNIIKIKMPENLKGREQKINTIFLAFCCCFLRSLLMSKVFTIQAQISTFTLNSHFPMRYGRKI